MQKRSWSNKMLPIGPFKQILSMFTSLQKTDILTQLLLCNRLFNDPGN